MPVHGGLPVFQLNPVLCVSVMPTAVRPREEEETPPPPPGDWILLGAVRGQCGCALVRGRLLLWRCWCLFTVLDVTLYLTLPYHYREFRRPLGL